MYVDRYEFGFVVCVTCKLSSKRRKFSENEKENIFYIN